MINLKPNKQGLNSQEHGFALLEVIVALVIMALVGLMAWRGMDAMIRGREVIDRRANQDADYSQLVRQFEKDCQSVLVRDELSSLANSQAGANANGGAVSAVASGAKNIWFLRRYRADNVDAWLIAGYGMGPSGLQRWTSKPLLQRSDAGALWFGISRDPDLASSDLLLSLEVPTVIRQAFQGQTSVLSGAGTSGISASGTGSPNATANISATTPSTNPPASTTLNVSNLLPEQQGVVMQWWIKDVALPITRSCLMGGAL
ncbi:type II secretion system protein J [Polynucleobacter sp. AP-Reno-20A-A9]|uniref:PulJ/GspJ family protein n=1 Tax=Polynucleobacter sp. AP-Reno-20A-A9 TaxID=2576925 RepID=UPI001C0D4052|nr:prepilin-type N-terminal cleavage/methylation domain-containing protein [Polynucleobacter sp. AP-Reno-20A-A9]MBU3629018.1 prepilin-type N-terminal cleavage/methylation domain-containing protein [Polynucleobacter sp. AP-Reno-20A-A9]